MELKKHIPFIVIVLAIFGTWNATRLDLANSRIEMRAEMGVLNERISVLDARVSTLSERVARIEGVLSGSVSSNPQAPSSARAAPQSDTSETATALNSGSPNS